MSLVCLLKDGSKIHAVAACIGAPDSIFRDLQTEAIGFPCLRIARSVGVSLSGNGAAVCCPVMTHSRLAPDRVFTETLVLPPLALGGGLQRGQGLFVDGLGMHSGGKRVCGPCAAALPPTSGGGQNNHRQPFKSNPLESAHEQRHHHPGRGLFWCVEAVYEQVDGVLSVQYGYCNGQTRKPSYEQVCNGSTSHAEGIRVQFDQDSISLREVLEIFFVVHDPSTLNRQGNSVGSQDRSGIYWHNPNQEAVVRAVVAEVDAKQGVSHGDRTCR
jgi:methionine-S-sulfoxide reductase